MLVLAVFVFAFGYSQGVKDTKQQHKEEINQALLKAQAETQHLQRELIALDNQFKKEQGRKKAAAKPIIQEVVRYVEVKNKDSPCFIDANGVRLLDKLCQQTGHCDNHPNL